MGREDGEGQDLDATRANLEGEECEEVPDVAAGFKGGTAGDPAVHHVVEQSRGIEAASPGHGGPPGWSAPGPHEPPCWSRNV